MHVHTHSFRYCQTPWKRSKQLWERSKTWQRFSEQRTERRRMEPVMWSPGEQYTASPQVWPRETRPGKEGVLSIGGLSEGT